MKRNRLNKKVAGVAIASQANFKFEMNMGPTMLGISRSIRVVGVSGKSASGTRPATK